MIRVVFIAPFFMPATLRFVRAIAKLENIKLGLISQDPLAKLPSELRPRVMAHYQVGNCLDSKQLSIATTALASQLGGVDRLLGTLEQLQEQLGEVRDKLGIPGMGAQAAHNFRNKAQMKSIFRRAGLPCARYLELTSPAEALQFAREVGFPMVVKPPAGAAAAATYRVQNISQLKQALELLKPQKNNPVVIEEFITGRECSYEALTIRGQVVWDSYTHYSPPPLHVLENPWIQWTVLLPREETTEELNAIRAPGRKALAALGMYTGMSHMEWFYRTTNGQKSAAISEVAARPPGAQIMTLNGYAHDVDFLHVWAKLVVHEIFEPPKKNYAAGAAFFRAQGRGQRIAKVHGLDKAQKKWGSLVVEAQLPQVGHAARQSYEGDGYAIIRHPSTDVVREALHGLISTVQVELA